ncbi:MAG: multiheme c-type cytochrome, partial [Pirellulaceae bacterium]
MGFRILVMPLVAVCHGLIVRLRVTGSASLRCVTGSASAVPCACQAGAFGWAVNERATGSASAVSGVKKLMFAAITGIISALPVSNGELLAQEAELNAAAHAPRESAQFLGVDRCERCHQAPTKADVDNRVTDFVLLNESKVWMSDIHSRAYQLIDPAISSLSKQICDKLHIADISQAQQCLSCHSNWLQGNDRPLTYDRGVACESCHGPSEHWDVPHSSADWRKKPVAEKIALGMIDVRNPIERAEQCFGCHIGSAAEGKILTHEMYAAGHPPLPGIEIESFAQQMPRHWRYLDEKVTDAISNRSGDETGDTPFAFFDEFLRENHRYLKLDEQDVNKQTASHNHRAAAVVLGGVIALRESLERIRDFASDAPPRASVWPELATFDCRACHHELATASWRQQREDQQRDDTVPGRPRIATWPTVLIRLAIRHVSPTRPIYDQNLSAFDAKFAALQSELQRSPFGSASRVHAVCSELAAWLTTEVVEPVSAKPFDDRGVADAINVLIVIGSTEPHEYDAARQ